MDNKHIVALQKELQSPELLAIPSHEKKTFLLSKGYTDDEIDMALALAEHPPWDFPLSPVAVVFITGILGFFLAGFITSWNSFELIVVLPLMSGSITFAIASAKINETLYRILEADFHAKKVKHPDLFRMNAIKRKKWDIPRIGHIPVRFTYLAELFYDHRLSYYGECEIPTGDKKKTVTITLFAQKLARPHPNVFIERRNASLSKGIRLESNEFHRLFVVSAEKDVHAFHTLNPRVMEILMEVHKKYHLKFAEIHEDRLIVAIGHRKIAKLIYLIKPYIHFSTFQESKAWILSMLDATADIADVLEHERIDTAPRATPARTV